jgi:hypothetical protein
MAKLILAGSRLFVQCAYKCTKVLTNVQYQSYNGYPIWQSNDGVLT